MMVLIFSVLIFSFVVLIFGFWKLSSSLVKINREHENDLNLIINVFKELNKEQEAFAEAINKNIEDIRAHENMLYIIDEELNLGLYEELENNNPPDSKNNLN